jgi:hypothetical protein
MSLSLEEAHKILLAPGSASYEQLHVALTTLSTQSDYAILGICADTTAQAERVLESYLKALNHEPPMPQIEPLEATGIYLKFNPRTGRCHTDSYAGKERGVIVSFHSPEFGAVNDTYGNLPLNLYLESS